MSFDINQSEFESWDSLFIDLYGEEDLNAACPSRVKKKANSAIVESFKHSTHFVKVALNQPLGTGHAGVDFRVHGEGATKENPIVVELDINTAIDVVHAGFGSFEAIPPQYRSLPGREALMTHKINVNHDTGKTKHSVLGFNDRAILGWHKGSYGDRHLYYWPHIMSKREAIAAARILAKDETILDGLISRNKDYWTKRPADGWLGRHRLTD